ncbi:FadR/GntR family transcriptional regulator [Alicycliphilus denitrificans]|uniref:FadR family transcriptional regulator n=1 Tax=Alicycliphilus denitrificans TaxID=179636 RepID=A0A420KHZ0_9BURK|nr:FadR/GntR family transcriptional regulator [Alicycliphilus denitrificans]RKJ99541.1 FadR family transcriptional regulator [Alicycliphilus denitrificans]
MTLQFQPVASGARLADQVADALEAEIRAGRLAPGARLPTEVALAAQFAVSRTVVREAVSRLKSLGMVDSRQGSGVYVRAAGAEPLRFEAAHLASRDAVVQMAELRRPLESEVAALAAERRTPQDLARIRAAIGALDEAVAAGQGGAEQDLAFHLAVAEAAHNPFLIGTLQYLHGLLQGAIRVTRANEARRDDFAREVAREHERIAQAIEAGDPVAAREAAKAHMDNAIRRIGQADPAFWRQEGARLAQPLIEGRAPRQR